MLSGEGPYETPVSSARLAIAADGEVFRCAMTAIDGARGTCVIVQSGQAGAYDEPSAEAMLHRRLGARLRAEGIRTVQFDMPLRARRDRPATDAEIRARTRRLLAVLAEPGLTQALARYVLLGVSLGARSVLEVAAEGSPPIPEPLGLILVGYVPDDPVRIAFRNVAIDLVYGGNDLLAEVDEHGRILSSPQRPEEYAPMVAELLATGIRRPRLHVLDGLGHLLTADPRRPLQDSGDAAITQIVVNAHAIPGRAEARYDGCAGTIR